MIAADSNDPILVLIAGALVAGLSALMKTWFENRDARKAAERQLDVAIKRTQFVKEWIAVSKSFGENEKARALAVRELNEAYADAQSAIQREAERRATVDQRVIQQLRYLLMAERRSNAWSYVVSGAFLLLSTTVALDIVRPVGGSLPSEAARVLATALTIRVIAGLMVRELEQHADKEVKESVADQVNSLLMFRRRGNPLSYVVSAAFLCLLLGGLAIPTLFYLDSRADDSGLSYGCVGFKGEDEDFSEVELLDKNGNDLTESSCEPLEGESDSGGLFYYKKAEFEEAEVIRVCTGTDKDPCIEDWYYFFPPAPGTGLTMLVSLALLVLLPGRLVAGLLVRWLERFSSRRSASTASLAKQGIDDSVQSKTPDPVG
jgi:hypothetical protein